MNSTISVNFATTEDIFGANPSSKKSVSAKVLADILRTRVPIAARAYGVFRKEGSIFNGLNRLNIESVQLLEDNIYTVTLSQGIFDDTFYIPNINVVNQGSADEVLIATVHRDSITTTGFEFKVTTLSGSIPVSIYEVNIVIH